MSAIAEKMDTELAAEGHILVPKELFVGLLDNTRELIGTQQWRKGTTQSNDRELVALEQEVTQAERVLQNPPNLTERDPFEPADNYEALRKQFRSLDMLERNCRKMLHHYQQKDTAQEREKRLASADALTSEHEANQRLTDELERLERELEQAHAAGMRRAAEICRGLLPTHEQMQQIEEDGFSFSQTTKWCHDKILEEARGGKESCHQ